MKNLNILIIILFPFIVFSQNPNRYILKTKTLLDVKRLKSDLDLRNSDELNSIFEELNLFYLNSNEEITDLKNKIKANSNIEFIIKDIELQYRKTPNDQFFSKQYAPGIINATEVWESNTGGITGVGDTIVIAVLDLGVDAAHEDLKKNIWKNYSEKPGDKVDNDGNGYIDDHKGLDLATKNDNLNSHYHGTGVAGIIGANGDNGIGISGINWDIKILPMTSIRYVSDVIEAYNYIYNLRKTYNNSNGAKGAFIVSTNLSAGFDGVFPSDNQLYKDWCNIYDLLGTVGILNVNSASNDNINVETEGDMPTLCTSDFLIPVTSTDINDKFDVTKAFGTVSIDIAAPGREIYTLSTDNSYRNNFTGNSAAAPHIAGAIGLLYTIPCKGFTDKMKANPAELSLKIKDYLLEYSDKHTDLKDKTLSGGRINIFNTYLKLVELCGELPAGKLSFNLIPNPAIGNLNMEYDVENYNDHSLIIFNALGQLVSEETFRPVIFGSKIHKIDIKGFPGGIYYVRFGSGKNFTVKPLLVVRK